MYPICLEITDRLCVVVGGGAVAERKIKGLLAAGAAVRLVSPDVTEVLKGFAAANVIEWIKREYTSGDLSGALLVIAATDNGAVQKSIRCDANAAGQLVNVIDQPAACTFQVPASVRRGDLTLTVSTNGRSPAVAAMIRRELEEQYGKEYSTLLEVISWVREKVLATNKGPHERKLLLQKVLHKNIVLWIQTGQWDQLQDHLQSVLGADIHIDFSYPGGDR